MPQRIFVDADVLASRTQYDWLALLRDEAGGCFQLHSSCDVVVESVRSWVGRDPAVRSGASRRRLDSLAATLDEVVGDRADADRGGGPRRGTSVHDAAASEAHVLLSAGAREVAGDAPLPFEIYTPDEFFCLVDDSTASHVRSAAIQQEQRTRAPDGVRAVESLTAALIAANCPAFAERVSSHLRARGA